LASKASRGACFALSLNFFVVKSRRCSLLGCHWSDQVQFFNRPWWWKTALGKKARQNFT
jgi:hypothetical protein